MNTRQALPIAMIVGGVSALGFLVLVFAIREFSRTRRAEAAGQSVMNPAASRPPTIRRGLLTESDRVLRAVRAHEEEMERRRQQPAPEEPAVPPPPIEPEEHPAPK